MNKIHRVTVTPPKFIKSNLIIYSYKVYSYSAQGTQHTPDIDICTQHNENI